MYGSSNNGRRNLIINSSKVTSYTKHKLVRLKGKKLKELNDKIFDRDNSLCIRCGTYVSNKEKFHHVNQASKKEDIVSNGVVLCKECHSKAHNSKKDGEVKEIKQYCIDYLVSIYNNREYFK